MPALVLAQEVLVLLTVERFSGHVGCLPTAELSHTFAPTACCTDCVNVAVIPDLS
jgi:hypothetical protein